MKTPDASIPTTPDGRQLCTASGIPLRAVYTADDVGTQREDPGEYPFTRGIDREMYRRELWHADLYAGFGDAESSRDRYEFLLRQGASGVNIALDLPTQLGLDSDNPQAEGEVGKVGLAVDTLRDIETVFEKRTLADVKIVYTVGNAIGPLAAAWFIALGKKQHLRPADFVVHLQNDPLKEYTGRGTFILPIEPSIKIACDVIEYAVREGLSAWKPIGICGSQYRWAGGNAVQEIGFGIAQAVPFIEELLGRGLEIDQFAPLLEMHLTADLDVFEEVAKFRAARRLWAELLRERYGARNPRSLHLRISLYTAGYRLTKQEPLNNSVRIALQAMAAVLGGVQHVGLLSIDEAMSTPSEEAVRLAVRTQQILAYEARLGHVADPLGGSYLVERLTDEIEERARALCDHVDLEGGTVAAIRSGYLQNVIDDAAYSYAKAVDDGTETIIGVNRFAEPIGFGDSTIKAFRGDPSAERRQVERLNAVRVGRDEGKLRNAIESLESAISDDLNVVEPMVEAVSSYATVGEIFDVLIAAHGTYQQENINL